MTAAEAKLAELALGAAMQRLDRLDTGPPMGPHGPHGPHGPMPAGADAYAACVSRFKLDAEPHASHHSHHHSPYDDVRMNGLGLFPEEDVAGVFPYDQVQHSMPARPSRNLSQMGHAKWRSNHG